MPRPLWAAPRLTAKQGPLLRARPNKARSLHITPDEIKAIESLLDRPPYVVFLSQTRVDFYRAHGVDIDRLIRAGRVMVPRPIPVR